MRWLLSRAHPMIGRVLNNGRVPLPQEFITSEPFTPTQLVEHARRWLPKAGLAVVSEERLGPVHGFVEMTTRLAAPSARNPFYLYLFWGGGRSAEDVDRVAVLAFDTTTPAFFDGHAGEVVFAHTIDLVRFSVDWINRMSIGTPHAGSVVFALETGESPQFV